MPHYQSTKQLFWMKKTLLDQGVTCVYLSANVKQTRYHMDLMAWLFRFEDFNRHQYWFRYKGSSLYMKHTSNPPHTLRGYKASIIADHAAFEGTNDGEYQEYQDLIKRSKRYEHP